MLDNEKTYLDYDAEEMSYGIEHMPEQFRVAYNLFDGFTLPKRYQSIECVVVVGMGTVGAVAETILFATEGERTLPMHVIRDYQLPKWVNHKTLVILLSTSGSTKEVLSSFDDAKKRQAKMIILSGQGTLLSKAKNAKIPYKRMNLEELAYSPREAAGYSFGALLGVLGSLRIIKMTKKRFNMILAAMAEVVSTSEIQIEAEKNPAKIVAEELHDRKVHLLAAEHLTGTMRLVKNTLEEMAKHSVGLAIVPEANHHFDESLFASPKKQGEIEMVMFHSELYRKENQHRMEVSAAYYESQGFGVIDYSAKGSDSLEQAAEVMQFGAFVGYYMALLKKQSPQKPKELEVLKQKLQS